MDTAKTTTFSRLELGVLLSMTALPIMLTSVAMRLLHATDAFAVFLGRLGPACTSLLFYALANWLTFTLVYAVAGRRRLEGHGLRLVLDRRRVGAGVAAFIVGLGVYGVVTAFARAVGLPAMRGMDYVASDALQIALLLASTAVTAAFCEEVFFRVLWIGALGERVPRYAAVAVSLLAFAAIHYPYFGAGGVLFISVWALLPIALFLRFGDVSAPVTMHALNNAFAYVVVPLFLR